MTYKALVIDDDNDALKKLKHYFETNFQKELTVSYLSIVSDRNNLVGYDLYILDIDLGHDQQNGFELAETIQTANPDAAVIFCTDHDELIFDSFQFNTLYFVRKEYFIQEMDNAVKKYLRQRERDDKCYVLQAGGMVQKIAYREICCFTSFGNQTVINIKDGKIISENRMLGQIYAHLPHDIFYRLSRQEVINLNNIERIEKSCVYMKNGQHIQIPHGRIKQLKAAFIRSI